MSEQEEDSESEAVQSDAGREEDEVFEGEHEPGVSQRKAEKITQQLKQGTATFVSKAGTHGRQSRDNASSGTDSDYRADFLDGDATEPSEEHQSGESEPDENESSGERVPDPAWQAMIVRRGKRRASGNAAGVVVGHAETNHQAPLQRHDDSGTKDKSGHRLTKTRGPPSEAVKDVNRSKPTPSEPEQERVQDRTPEHGAPAPGSVLAPDAMEHFVDEHFVVTARKPRRATKNKVKAPIADRIATRAEPQPAMAMNAATKAQRSVQMPGRVVPKRRPSPEYFGTASEDDESVELVASLQPKAARAKASKTTGLLDRVETSKSATGGTTKLRSTVADSDDNGASSGDEASVRQAPTKPPVKWAIVTALTYNEDGKTPAGIMSQRSGKVKSLLSEAIAHELPRALLRVNAFPNKYARPQMFLDILVDASVRLNYTDITERLLNDSKYSTDMMKNPIDRISSVRGPLYKSARDIAWEAYGLKALEGDPSAIKKATLVLTFDNHYISPGTLKNDTYGDFQPNLPFCARPIIQIINTLFFGPNAFFPLEDEFFTSSIKTGVEATQLEIPIVMASFIATMAGAAIREGLDGARHPLRSGQGFNATVHETHYIDHVNTLTGINVRGRHKLLAYMFKTAKTYHLEGSVAVDRPGGSKFVNNETAGNDIDDAML